MTRTPTSLFLLSEIDPSSLHLNFKFYCASLIPQISTYFHICINRQINYHHVIIDVFFLLCPFSFSQDLVEWSFCGSKSAYALDATLQKFLNNSTSEPNKCFPTGDVEVFADNTQLKRKNIRVRKNDLTPIELQVMLFSSKQILTVCCI